MVQLKYSLPLKEMWVALRQKDNNNEEMILSTVRSVSE